MMTEYTLTLLAGTQLVLGENQTLILPEDHSGLHIGDEVLLENEKREKIGTGTVRDIKNVPYAHLQSWDFFDTAHKEITSWAVGAETLSKLVPEFSVTDPSSVIHIQVESLFEPSFTINSPATPFAPLDVEPVPTEEEMYTDLEESAK